MLREICNLMEAMTADHPWIIVLEDLHWSDRATLDVLSRLARGTRTASLLILATYRPADVLDARNPILRIHQDLQIHKLCSELALDRLSPLEFGQYLLSRFGHSGMTYRLGELVFRRTWGQPFITVSLIDYFIAQDAIVAADGHWRLGAEDAIAGIGMPSDLREMIGRHIDRLPPNEQHLLEIGSAAGAEFSAALAAGAAGSTVLEVERAFEALARNSQLLVTAGVSEWPDGTVSGRYNFQHALYQEVLYRRLGPGHRVDLHRRLGERLEQGYEAKTIDIASVLAQHFEVGRDFSKAVRYLGQAAESAAKRFGYSEAGAYLTRALGLVDRLVLEDRAMSRTLLLRQRGLVRRAAWDLTGSSQDLNAMIAHAANAGQVRLEVSGLVELSRTSLFGDRRECLPAAAQAAAKSQFLKDEIAAVLVKGLSAHIRIFLTGWREADVALCRQAMAISQETDDPAVLLRSYAVAVTLTCMRSEYDDCHAAAVLGKSLAQDTGDVFYFIIFNSVDAAALGYLGEWRELRKTTEAALVMAERNANPIASVICRLIIAWLHYEAFDFAGSRSRCEATPVTKFEESSFTFFVRGIMSAKACLGLHDYPAALTQLDAMHDRLELPGNRMDFACHPLFYLCFCEYWTEMGDLTRARNNAMQLLDYTAAAPDRHFLALAHRSLARIALAEGNAGEAGTHVSRALATLDDARLPLAAWRVYLTAAVYSRIMGDQPRATNYQTVQKP